MAHLYKWKIKTTPNCSWCNTKETVCHAIFECPIANNAIQKLKTLIQEKIDIEVTLTKNDCLLGIDNISHSHISSSNRSMINRALILIKRKLILQREAKSIISENEIRNCIEGQLSQENYGRKTYQ
jgi:hypothetical protein